MSKAIPSVTVECFVIRVWVALLLAVFVIDSFASGNSKPQTPVPPYPYSVRALTVENTQQKVSLDGTLTLPASDSAVPAVVLLSVAGPNDRNQGFAGHAGFHVLADYLTRRGIAVARFDDRGVGGSTGNYFAASWNDLSSDANAIIKYLQQQPGIDPHKIGVAGMSQGGAVGALTAGINPDVAFLILLSSPGLSGEQTLALQLEKTMEVSGISGATADQYRQLFSEFMGIVKSDPEHPDTLPRLDDFLSGPGRALIPPYQFMPRDNDGLKKILTSPWYRSNVLFEPKAVYQQLRIPVLAVGGDKDLIAPPDQHLTGIEQLLEVSAAEDIYVARLPDLNHLLQEANTGLPIEYPVLENSMSNQVLELISGWITQRFIE